MTRLLLLFAALSLALPARAADMFWDARFAMRHAGFLFQLPAVETTMLWTMLLGVAILIATLFWGRARANQSFRNGQAGVSGRQDQQTAGKTLLAAQAAE